jgi:hypothetical protein
MGGNMLFRAIALSLALLIGIGAIVPLATEMVEAGPHKVKRTKNINIRSTPKNGGDSIVRSSVASELLRHAAVLFACTS